MNGLIASVVMGLVAGIMYSMLYTSMVYFFMLDPRIGSFLTGGLIGLVFFVWGYSTGSHNTSDK